MREYVDPTCEPWGSGAVEIGNRNVIIADIVGLAQAHPLTEPQVMKKQPPAGLGPSYAPPYPFEVWSSDSCDKSRDQSRTIVKPRGRIGRDSGHLKLNGSVRDRTRKSRDLSKAPGANLHGIGIFQSLHGT